MVKKKTRTVGINFPHTEDGDFVHEAIRVTSEQEDRSISKIIFRLLKNYFDETGDEFKAFVHERVTERHALDSVEVIPFANDSEAVTESTAEPFEASGLEDADFPV